MKKGSFLSFLVAVTAVVVVGLVSAGGALGANGQQTANLRQAPGPVAGLLSDGSVYVTSTTDNFWHEVDPATLTQLGYSTADIEWYGSGGLPGSIAPNTVALNTQPATYQSFATLVLPPVNLAGLLSTHGIYIAQNGLFWPVSAADFAQKGYSLSWVSWFGQLPGTIAAGANQ